MRRWINSVPNEGLIRYNFYLNTERVFLTSPKALAEVLVTKNYDFPKPDEARHALGRLLGFGILLAEGDEHKVRLYDKSACRVLLTTSIATTKGSHACVPVSPRQRPIPNVLGEVG